MPHYRIFFFDGANRIRGFEETECDSDQSAIQAGKPLLETYPKVEVWERSRRVAYLSPDAVDVPKEAQE
jgi:hypothetical protein